MEFGFGFPPRIFGVRYRDTLYSLNWIPLGGFVKMVGEEDPTNPRSFARKSIPKRTIVLLAGSSMNLLLAVVVFTVMLMLPQDTVVGSVIISGVIPDSPGGSAGLRAGDIITSIDGHRIDNHLDLIQKIMARLGGSAELTVRRGAAVSGLPISPEFGVVDSVTVVPRLNPPPLTVVEDVTDPEREISLADAQRYDRDLALGDTIEQGAIGIIIGTSNAKVATRSSPLWEAFPASLGRIQEMLLITKNVIVRWIAGGPDPGLVGPVGIAQVTGEVAKVGVSPLFELIAFISVSLGIVNLLPIPALDGGRLIFVVLEWVRRGKRISPQREGLVHLIGFALVIGLFLVMTYRDVTRIVSGDSFF